MDEHRGLWHGKNADSGEWIEGFLSKSRNVWEKPALLKFCIDYEEKGVMVSCIVDPKTLGECAGFADKNNKHIFEGDIVKHFNHGTNAELFDIGVVFWDEKRCCFKRTSKDGNTYFLGNDEEYEVIGNIHDNPELLKGGEQQ